MFMHKSKKGFTIVELVIVIAVVAILAAVLIPSFSSLIKKANNSAYLQERTNQQIADLAEKVENQDFLTWEDLEAKLAEELAKIPATATPEEMKTAVEKATTTAVADFEKALKNNNSALTEAQVKAIVEKALEGQLTTAQVEAIVKAAVETIELPEGETVTPDQIKAIVDNAIAGLDKETGITKEEMASAIETALKAQDNLSAADVTTAINNALAGFGYGNDLSKSEVQAIIESAMGTAKLTADQHAVKEMNEVLAKANTQPTKIQDVKLILEANGYNHKLDPIFQGHSFAWIAEKNVIVLVDGEKVTFPEEYANYDYTKVELFNVTKVDSEDALYDLSAGNVGILNGMDSIVLEKDFDIDVTNNKDGNENYFQLHNVGNLEIDGNGQTLATNLCVTTGTSLTLTNVTIDSDNTNSGSAIKPLDGAIYMTNTTVKANLWAFAQNISQSKDSVVGIVKDCNFDGKYSLYIGKGTWTFENCTFDGTVTITGGNVTFKNCTFNAKADNNGTTTASASGSYSSDYAIVLADGRSIGETSFANGEVNFIGCTVNNANGAVGNWTTLTYTVADGNKVTGSWN